MLIVEDNDDICQLYSIWLKEHNHQYVITKNYEDGINEYKKSLYDGESDDNSSTPFDLVIVDYDLPSQTGSLKNGLCLAKEILELNNDQRLMFASAWPKKAFMEYVSTLKSIPEILPKPFDEEEFISLAEKINLYSIAKKITMNLRKNIKNPNEPTVDFNVLEAIFKLMNRARKELLQKDNDSYILKD